MASIPRVFSAPFSLLSPSSSCLNQVRGYLKAFWTPSTKYPFPGHMRNWQRPLQYKYRTKREVDHKRVSDIKRIRKYGYQMRMSYATGRRMIMDKILKEEKYLGEA